MVTSIGILITLLLASEHEIALDLISYFNYIRHGRLLIFMEFYMQD